MVASRQRNHFVPISIKQETALFWKSMFLYFGCESKCALFEYRSRRLNIKLFAAVVYFCLVDCYSCMKCKNVRDWKDHEDKNSKHISLNFLSSKLEQMAEVFNCHGSSHGRARDKKTKVKKGKKDRNKNRHSFDVQSLGQFKTLDQIPRFEYILSPHPAAAYHWDCQSNSLTEYATFFFFFFVFCRWNLSPSYPIKVHDLVGASTHFPFLL